MADTNKQVPGESAGYEAVYFDQLQRENARLKERLAEYHEALAKYNRKMGSLPTGGEPPASLIDGLRQLAEWLDAFYERDTPVQRDLRRWANLLEKSGDETR